MEKYTSEASVFAPNYMSEASPIFFETQGAKQVDKYYYLSRRAKQVTVFRLPSAGLNTSYDWLQPERQNTRVEQVYLYKTLRAKRIRFFRNSMSEAS